MDKLFGTDGIRSVAGQFPLDHSTVYFLGNSLIGLLQEMALDPLVIIGRDTRESGEWLEQSLFQGITEAGGEAVSAGVIPTSAISILTKKYPFSAGIVISASHNPFQDNGIKIFSPQGTKIPEEWERKLEQAIMTTEGKVKSEKVEVTPTPLFTKDYLNFLKSQFSHIKLQKNLKVVLDCSNGASSFLAPRLLSDLGFEVLALNNSPDGKNINDCCGSLYPQTLSKEVVECRADIGIAYDGDADRTIWVDEKGRILNGDHTLFILSRFMKKKGRLKSDCVVATTMSNLGLELALNKLGLKLLRTQVGDKYVLQQMMKIKANLGGEQSGHTIFLDDCPTGDGILTSLKMLEVMATDNSPLSRLAEDFKEFPQVLESIRVSRKIDFHQFPEIIHTIEKVKNQLGDSGRLNVRYSGTESLARIMVEGQDKDEIEHYAKKIARVVEKYLG